MSEDRPLDALFPELRAAAPNDTPDAPTEPVPQGELPVLYPKVLEVELEEWQEWTFALWRQPETSLELEEALTEMLEATLLMECSRPPGWGGIEERHIKGIHLFAFAALSGEDEAVLARCGFARVAWDPERYANRMQAWKNEGKTLGASAPDAPMSLWWSEFGTPDPELARALTSIHEAMATRLGTTLWGAQPGVPSHMMAGLLERHFQLSCKPDVESLHALDMLLVERTPGVIRWMPPMIFQGLCDFVGVLLMAKRRREVRWGACESDREGGHLPPLLRFASKKGPLDINVGLALVRAIIMPIAQAEDAPLLRDWFEQLIPAQK